MNLEASERCLHSAIESRVSILQKLVIPKSKTTVPLSHVVVFLLFEIHKRFSHYLSLLIRIVAFVSVLGNLVDV